MKSNLEKVSSLERKLNIEIPSPEVQAAFEKAFLDIQKSTTIKGFRKGKAPLTTIRSIYGDKVKQDVLHDLVEENYWAALREHALHPAGTPTIDFNPLTEGDFKFSAAFEIFPEIVVNNFEQLPILREKMPDIEGKVEDALNRILENRATDVPVLEDRPAKSGDIAMIDFEGFLNDQPFEGGKADDLPLKLGSKNFIDGFEEGVIGMKPGDTKSLQLKFPQDYHAQNLAGKDVRFEVKLKSLKTKSRPNLDDEFAKSLGSYATLEDFKKMLRESIQRDEENRIREDVKARVLRALVERNPVEVPKTLHDKQKSDLIGDVSQRIKEDGGSASDIEEYKKKWNEEFDKSATFMIQSGLLLDALAEKLSLSATEDEIETKIRDYAASSGIELSKLKEHYSRRAARSKLAFKITEEKVIDFLLSKSQIREVSPEELAAGEK